MEDSKDSLGDRMKFYEEKGGVKDVLLPLIPAVCRIDGNNFSKFTKGLKRPYDERLSSLMQATTRFLVEYSNACIGYTQSDEITLVWKSNSIESQIFMNGRRDKMNTLLAGRATAFFNRNLASYLPEKEKACTPERSPVFDCRVWNVPNEAEACNVLIWRELDATKNSISMAAQHYFSHKQLQGRSGPQMQEMLFKEHDINWNDYPEFFKRGTYVQRKHSSRLYTPEELEKLPPKHNARTNPNLTVERSEVHFLKMPIFRKIANREDVVFRGADPEAIEGFVPRIV